VGWAAKSARSHCSSPTRTWRDGAPSGFNAITSAAHAARTCAIRAAEHLAIRFHSVTGDATSAVRAVGRERVDGALEAVEHVALACQDHLEALVVVVVADLALCLGSGSFVRRHTGRASHRVPNRADAARVDGPTCQVSLDERSARDALGGRGEVLRDSVLYGSRPPRRRPLARKARSRSSRQVLMKSSVRSARVARSRRRIGGSRGAGSRGRRIDGDLHAAFTRTTRAIVVEVEAIAERVVWRATERAAVS
jgi:hypothetical protein